MCRDENIPFINHTNVIDPKRNLNNSKLHLNTKGSIKIRDNIVKYLRAFSIWNNARSYTESSDGIDKKVGALSCVNTEDPLEESDFGTFSTGKFSDLHSLSNIRKNNINRLILAHININSIRKKLDQLVDGIKGKVDVLMISETKTDNSFPAMQLLIEKICVFRLDRNEYGDGILVYVREDIPSKLIPMKNRSIESFFIEQDLRTKKWLLCSPIILRRILVVSS